MILPPTEVINPTELPLWLSAVLGFFAGCMAVACARILVRFFKGVLS